MTVINDTTPLGHDTSEDDCSGIVYYEDLARDELILLQGYNYLCIRQDPGNKVIYEAKIQYIKNLLQKDQSR